MLESGFRPAVQAVRAFDAWARGSGSPVAVRMALEQTDGSVFHFETRLLPSGHAHSTANAVHLERFVKFILWSRGGWRLHIDAPAGEVARLQAHYRDTPAGQFDSNFVGERVFDHPFTIVRTPDLPPERSVTKPLGRHLNGNRIGFDLGGSDRKVAAVVGGRVVFSDETVWYLYHKPDPHYHFDGIDWARCARPRRISRVSTPSAAAPPASTSTTGSVVVRCFAVSHRISSMRTSGTCFSTCARPGTTRRSRL